MRERLLAQVHARLERFSDDDDPTDVLEAAATAELTALLGAVPDPTADLEVAHAAGWLHWCRYLVLDPGDDEEDFAAALALLEPVHVEHPDAVPEEVRPYFNRSSRPSSGSPGETASHGNAFLQHALRTADRAALDTAVDMLRQAVAATPTGDPSRARRLSTLGTALHTRFEWTGEADDLAGAVDAGRAAVAATPADHPQRAGRLSSLGVALQTRFEWTGNTADLDEAVDAACAAVAATPEGHPARMALLSNAGLILHTRFERTGNTADLDEAVDAARAAVAATPEGHPERATPLSNLGQILHTKFERTGAAADLDGSVDANRAALAATRAVHPDRARRLSALGMALHTRFEQTGNAADLDEAVDAGRAAVATTPAGHPDRGTWLSNLGLVLTARFKRTADVADLDEAVAVTRAAVGTYPVGHADHAKSLAALGAALRARFARTGNRTDLDEAVTTSRATVAATPEGHPERAIWSTNLGAILRARSRRTGNQDDFEDAVDANRGAVVATPEEGHPARAERLSALSLALQDRFERTREQADIDTAVDTGRAAVAATPLDDPALPGRLSNLGIALHLRFGWTGNAADLDEAVEVSGAAVAASSASQSDHALQLANLAAALRTRSERAGDQADVDRAVDATRAAVEATSEGDPNRAGLLSNLGAILHTRFERTGNQEDLDEAVEVGRAAVAATPVDDPDRAIWLSNLGRTLETRFERTENPDNQSHLDEAIAAYREGAAIAMAPPGMRVHAARGWGRSAGIGQRWPQAVEAYTRAVERLGLAVPRNLTRSDQEHWLANRAGFASDAAACCLHAGMPDRAVELFEQGRAVLFAQALDARTDLTALKADLPELADRLASALASLDAPPRRTDTAVAEPAELFSSPAATSAAQADDRRRRRQAAADLDRVLTEIRSQAGYRGFLFPLPTADLLPAAADGPVVVVNVSRFRSDALIVTAEGVLPPVPLPGLTPDTARSRVMEFLAALACTRSDRRDADRRLSVVLEWLWDTVASPVLNRLGILGPPAPGEPWPRLWWCPSGLLSFLPLHAAGYHDTRHGPAPATVMDRVVSSYTPTIRALAHARRRRPDDNGGATAGAGDGGVLLVAMPRTPGASELPGVVAEGALVRALFPGQVRVLAGDSLGSNPIPPPVGEANHEAVLAALPGARWVHFACHAASDLEDPSASRLLLVDHRTRPLTVVDITRLRLGDPEFAFLSACSTAQPGTHLPDEVIHLSSAFQLAGYRHVVATLWPVPDLPTQRAVTTVYNQLAAAGAYHADRAPVALHATTVALRKRYPTHPSIWAAFVHAGG